MEPDVQDQVEFIGGCEGALPSATEKRSISLLARGLAKIPMPDCQPSCLGGKHITETKVWTAHITVRPGLKVVDREVLEKRVGFINRRLLSAARRIGIRDDERYIRVVRRGKYRGTGPAPSLERYEAGDVAAGGPR